MNIDNLVINRVVRGTLFDKSTNEVLVSINQISDASLECSGEQVYATDALGQRIAAFDRSKEATFSASNALINFGLMAAQFGSDAEYATSTEKMVVPKFELIEVTGDATKITLAEMPATDSVKYIYSTHADKSKGIQYPLGSVASETEFAISGKEITLPLEQFVAGDRVAIWYEIESENAQRIINSTATFAKGGRFVLEVLACDVCDVNTEYYAYVIFNNAKFDNNTTIDFNTEATQAFTINALQDYCSASNELFEIIIAA